MTTTLRKVICVTCRSIFKVREDPALDLLDDPGEDMHGRPLDPYGFSALYIRQSLAGIAYCRHMCPYCGRGGRGPIGLVEKAPCDD